MATRSSPAVQPLPEAGHMSAKWRVTVESKASGAVVPVEADDEEQAKQKALEFVEANRGPKEKAEYTATKAERVEG